MNKYKKHIQNLCRRHGIGIVLIRGKWLDCEADPMDKEIFIVDIEQPHIEFKYVAALHEIGHVINEYPFADEKYERKMVKAMTKHIYPKWFLDQEIEAWKTARKIAKWWTDQMTRCECMCLHHHIINHEGSCRQNKRWFNFKETAKALSCEGMS